MVFGCEDFADGNFSLLPNQAISFSANVGEFCRTSGICKVDKVDTCDGVSLKFSKGPEVDKVDTCGGGSLTGSIGQLGA